jgi:hypothetical protein
MLNELTRRCREVWLIGSRANPTEKPPNDWDVIALGDNALLNDLRARPPVQGLDLLIVFDGDNFESPWRRLDGNTNGGSLSGWRWHKASEAEATYVGTKARDGDDFRVDSSQKKAIRIIGKWDDAA